MDGGGVKSAGSLLGAGERRLVLRLVRPEEDHGPLLDLFEKAHQETRFNYIPFSRERAERLLRQVIAKDERHLVVLADVGGKPEGFVFASIGENFVETDALTVTINVLYTSEALRNSLLGGKAATSLLNSVRKWGTAVKAKEVLLHATSGVAPKRTGTTVRRLGFEEIGSSFAATLLNPSMSNDCRFLSDAAPITVQRKQSQEQSGPE